MSARSQPAGVRLHGFAGLGLRSLRARPLRSVLTSGGIVLGVGMVFGVLILVSTIHSSFSNLFDAIYGNTSVIVSGRSAVGSVPDATLARVRAVDGVAGASGDVFGVFRIVDENGEARSGRNATLFVEGSTSRRRTRRGAKSSPATSLRGQGRSSWSRAGPNRRA